MSLDIGYVAGIIDGEGCIGFHEQQDKYLYGQLQVTMTCENIVKLLHRDFGGCFCEKSQRKGNYKIAYTWSVRGYSMTVILEKIFPYLIVKREQAELALAFHKLGDTTNSIINAFFKEEMHKLNKRGL